MFLFRDALDERGETLSTIIIFPFALALIFLTLQVWSLSSAQTTAQSAANEAVRAAQNSTFPAGADDNTIRQARADQGIEGALEWLENPVPYIRNPSGGYQPCSTQGRPTSNGEIYQYQTPASKACEDDPDEDEDRLASVSVGEIQTIAKVRVRVSSPLGNLGVRQNEVNSAACGPTAANRLAAQRSLVSAADADSPWQCDPN